MLLASETQKEKKYNFVNMAEEKQSEETMALPMEIEENLKNEKILRRTISAPLGNSSESEGESSVFSPNLIATRKTLEDRLTSEMNTIAVRSKSTSTCNSSISDDDSISKSRRIRTYSDSNQLSILNVDCSSTSPSPIPIGSPAPRVLQIRREESVDELTREVAKERDVTSAINLSRSWDEVSWLGDKTYAVTNETRDKRDSLDELMLQNLSPSLSSPVRFIDKIQNNRSLTPSPIAIQISPRQRKFRRSLSPSNLRPSLLLSKRKLDPDDGDAFGSSPAKRTSLFCSPASIQASNMSSSSSSPDHPSDGNSSHSNHCSCDEDSGNEPAFLPHSSSTTMSSTITPVHSLLSCDTRHNNSSIGFAKPRYIAPQSPLAAGVNSANTNDILRKSSLGSTSYTFTPVKE